jgi:hypothetical protein
MYSVCARILDVPAMSSQWMLDINTYNIKCGL